LTHAAVCDSLSLFNESAHRNADPTMNIYLLPGMAADRWLYDPITLELGEKHFISWTYIDGVRTLREYAEVLCSRITTENNIYIGSSMGGMVATEMAHILPPKKLILLSAPASRAEFPRSLNVAAKTKIGQLFSPEAMARVKRIADSFMGFKNTADRLLFYETLEQQGPRFLHFAVNAILEWDRKDRYANYIQIVGAQDRLFKARKMVNPTVIQGAGHFMTREQPHVLSDLINQELRRIQETIA
jgi:pimeloyl-ACP methyl ester carboxylesterase